MLDWPLELAALNDLWYRQAEATEEEKRQVSTLVDLVRAMAPGASPAAQQRGLKEAGSYWVWLRHFLTWGPSIEELEREWRRLVYERSLSASQSPPIPLPDQAILFLCRSPDYTSATLHSYLVDRSGWRLEVGARPIDNIYPLPDDAGLILVARTLAAGEPQMRLLLWQQGQTQVIYEGRIQNLIGPHGNHNDPAGRYLVLFDYDPFYATNRYTLLALNDCEAAGCELRQLPGAPVWSPDGSQMLAMALDENFTLLRGDGDGLSFHEIGSGLSPFWLDNETYGYLPVQPPVPRDGWDGPQTVVTAAASGDEARTLLALDDLVEAIPGGERPDELFLDGVAVSPADPQRLFAAVRGYPQPSGPGRSLLFAIDRQSGVVSLLWQADEMIVTAPGFSPDGRWLLFWTRGAESFGVYLYDTAENEVNRYALGISHFDWSADGQWLLKVDDGYFTLLAPAHDFRRLVFHDWVNCHEAFWTD